MIPPAYEDFDEHAVSERDCHLDRIRSDERFDEWEARIERAGVDDPRDRKERHR